MTRFMAVILLMLGPLALVSALPLTGAAVNSGMVSTGAVSTGVVFAGAARVVDGDTLVVAGERIRLHGIDAPETGQTCAPADWACGAWATATLEALIAGRETRCTGIERDRYDRLVATCNAGGADIGAAMVEAGAAIAFRRYSTVYVAQEEAARRSHRGLWSEGPQAVVAPREWRRGASPAQPVAGDCAIKGNISPNGRIYHLPGQRDYDRTVIDPARGERWFCTEAEARAAGWRRAAR